MGFGLDKVRETSEGLYKIVIVPDTQVYIEDPTRKPTDVAIGFDGTVNTEFGSGKYLNVTNFYNTRLDVKKANGQELSDAVGAINELNRQLGDVHDWPTGMGDSEFTAQNVRDAVQALWIRGKSNKIVARDAVKLTSEGQSGTKIDVLYDATLANGSANTTDPTIRLTTATETPGANKLRAIDFKSDKLKVVNAAGTKLTSGVDAINILNSEIGPYTKAITTSEGNRDKTLKGVVNWLDSKINDFVLPRIDSVESNPIVISNKNTYWANKSDADNNPLYITSEHTLQNKYLHIYDYPVKDVRVVINDATGTSRSTIRDKDVTNTATIEFEKGFTLNNSEISLILDNNGTIIRDATTGALKTDIVASEGLRYDTFISGGKTHTKLSVDLDTTKNLLGFKNGKLDIPWISSKPTSAERDKIMGIDSQGNAIWINNVTYYDELKNLPKIDGVILRGSSEGARIGNSLDDLHVQRKLVPENTSIVFTSDGTAMKIRANYLGIDDIKVQEGTALNIRTSDKHKVSTGNRNTRGGAVDAFTYTLTSDLLSVDTSANKILLHLELKLRSNGSYSYSGLNPTTNYVNITNGGNTLTQAGLTDLAAGEEKVIFSITTNVTYTDDTANSRLRVDYQLN